MRTLLILAASLCLTSVLGCHRSDKELKHMSHNWGTPDIRPVTGGFNGLPEKPKDEAKK